MKLTIEAPVLAKALSRVTGIVEKRTTVPILSMVVIDATPVGVTLTATDLERQVTTRVAAEVEKPNRVCVDAHTLSDIARKLRGDVVIALVPKTESLSIKSGASSFALPTLPAEDFPSFQADNLPHEAEFPADVLLSAIERTRFAISTEETRYYLNGIFLNVKSGRLLSVATDGHRLACIDMGEAGTLGKMPGVIIPRKTVDTIVKLLAGYAGQVPIRVSDTRIVIGIDGTEIASKLIDGTFPDYHRVIPKVETFATVSSVELDDSVDRVMTITSVRGSPTKLKVTSSGISISATDVQGAAASDSVDAEGSADLTIGFNGRYIRDICSAEEGQMQIGFVDPASPAVLRFLDSEGSPKRDLFVLMPMRV